MLIEFRVKNYKSIRDEQVLSFVASTDKSHMDTHLIPTGIKSLPYILKSAVIFGPNAGGKSNLIRALGFFKAFITDSATKIQSGETLNVQPFKLDKNFIDAPCELELTFLHKNIRYQLGFKITPKRILEEWLLVYKTSQPQQWYMRKFDEQTNDYSYKFSSYLKGNRKQWVDLTKENTLYLSVAAHWNSENLKPIYEYITNEIVDFSQGAIIPPDFSTQILHQTNDKAPLIKFLSSVDLHIADISIDKQKGFAQKFSFNPEAGISNGERTETELIAPKFHHKTKNGSAVFNLEDESLGTQRLYALAGPIIDILATGKTVIIDELDTSIHTLLVRHILDMFHSEKLNPFNAQIIFTTHDTALLDADIFRRDQIWFIEKNQEQASELFPLSDFSPRKNEAFEKGYLIGRYGGIPFLSDLS